MYQRNAGIWGSVAVTIPNNTTPPGTAPSASLVSSRGSNAFAHAPRPVSVQSANSTGTIGLLFQSSTPTSLSSDCLYWVTITGSAAAGATAANTLELSQYSNSPASTNCNLPATQGTYPDTAFSVATNPRTGDQYLGFVVNYPSGSSSGTAVYAMSYTGSSAPLGTWNTAGQTLNYNGTAVYVKSIYATVGLKSYSYMVINNNSAQSLELFYSPTLSTVTNTLYSPLSTLSYPSPLSGQSFGNPRIEAPQYINNNQYSMITTVPVWLQYVSATIQGTQTQSLIYWNNVPN